MFDLKGKKALVTGSTQGIGFAIAERLALQGAEVTVHGSKSLEKCEKAAAEMKANGVATTLTTAISDLSKPTGADELYEKVGNVDILVLNASIQYRKKWYEITAEEMETQLQTNFKSSLRLIQLMYPHMKENHWGRIVTIGSVQQYKPHRDMAVYAASKAAQMNLVKPRHQRSQTNRPRRHHPQQPLPRSNRHPAQRRRPRRPGLLRAGNGRYPRRFRR